MIRAHELMQNVTSHFEVVPGNPKCGDDVFFRVSFLHESVNVFQVNVLVWNVDIVATVVIYVVQGNQIPARLQLDILVELEGDWRTRRRLALKRR